MSLYLPLYDASNLPQSEPCEEKWSCKPPCNTRQAPSPTCTGRTRSSAGSKVSSRVLAMFSLDTAPPDNCISDSTWLVLLRVPLFVDVLGTPYGKPRVFRGVPHLFCLFAHTHTLGDLDLGRAVSKLTSPVFPSPLASPKIGGSGGVGSRNRVPRSFFQSLFPVA